LESDVARLAAHQRRLTGREHMALSQRLAVCERRLELRSTVSAKDYDTGSREPYKQSMMPPAADDETGVGPVSRLLRPIRNAICELERALDFDDGYADGRSTTTMIAEEKDRELAERWSGVPALTVSRIAPHLGSRRAIELARLRLGLHPNTGEARLTA
jgi:hypothetical protein